MAPKKRAAEAAGKGKAKAKAKLALPVEAAADAEAQPQPVSGNAGSAAVGVNGQILQQHLENVSLFCQAAGQEILKMPPRQQDMLPPFEESKAIKALASEGKYYCAMNLTWLNHAWSSCPQIPLNRGAICKIQEFFFPAPASFSKQKLVVAVLKAEVDGQRLPAPGMWKRISPEESVIAFYQSAAEAAKKALDGSTEAEQDVAKWLNFILATPCEIVVLENDSRYEWEAQQLREDLVQMTYLQRSPSQRIFDAVSKIEQMGSSYTPEAIVELYEKNLTLSSKTEKYTVHFLSCSQLVFDRALVISDVLDIIMKDEQSPQPLWASVSVLHATIAKTARAEEVLWIFTAMADAKDCGYLRAEMMSCRFLTGTRKDHNKGYVDLLLLKLRLRNFFLDEFLYTVAKSLPETVKTALKLCFSSFHQYRLHMGWPDRRSSLSWKAGWSAAADAALALMEDAVKSSKELCFLRSFVTFNFNW